MTGCSDRIVVAGLAAELVRYADDFVILMRGRTEATCKKVQEIIERLGLKLNDTKTRMVDARMGSFDFVGFKFFTRISYRSGRTITLTQPSRKSERRFRDEVRALTARWTHCRPQQEVMDR